MAHCNPGRDTDITVAFGAAFNNVALGIGVAIGAALV